MRQGIILCSCRGMDEARNALMQLLGDGWGREYSESAVGGWMRQGILLCSCRVMDEAGNTFMQL